MKYQKGSFIVVPNKNILRGAGMPAQAVFLWLCSYANTNGICIPARSTIATDIGITEDTVDAAIKKLCSLSILSKIPRFIGNRQLTNAYQIHIVESESEEDDFLSEEECNCGYGSPHMVRDCQTGGAENIGSGGRKYRLGGPKISARGAENIGTELNPVLTQSNELIMQVMVSEEKDQKTAKRNNIDGFAKFRDLYPRKEDMATASAEWRKLSPTERFEAIQDIPKRVLSEKWKEDDGKYIPLAKNYLKGKRWEDTLQTSKKRVYVV